MILIKAQYDPVKVLFQERQIKHLTGILWLLCCFNLKPETVAAVGL